MSSQLLPLKPIEAFRIVAWKACVYAEHRWRLGPMYYCPTCELPEKDLKAQPIACPKCPLTDLFNRSYKEAARREIDRRGGMSEGYTLEGLMVAHATVAGILADNGDRISPDWPVAFTELARIVLQERAQQKYSRDWDDWKRMTVKK
jgi:hypothetical protein